MADTVPVISDWSRGRVSDLAINLMPADASVTLQNFFPNVLGHPLVLRQAWSYVYSAHADFTFFSGSTTSIKGANYASYTNGTKYQVYVDSSGRILTVTSTGTGALADATGLAGPQGGPGVMWLDKLYLFDAADSKVWTVDNSGAAVSASGTAQVGRCGATWLNTLVVAHGRTLHFSDVALATFLVDGAGGSNFTFPRMEYINGVFPIANNLLVFGPRHMEMIHGTVPPGYNTSDTVLAATGYDQGMATPAAGKMWNGYVIFANEKGLWKTDGTQLVDITTRAGLSTAWRNDWQSFSNGWTCALGIYQNYAIVTVTNGTTEQFTYCFDLGLKNEVGFNLKGFPTTMYAEVSTGATTATANSEQDLLFGILGAAQAGRFQPCLSVGGTAGKDANGVAIEYDWVSAFYQLGSRAPKRFKRAYWDYALSVTTPYTEAAVWQYRVSNDPFNTISWTTMTAPPSGTTKREPTFVNDRARWIQFRVHGGTGAGTNNLALFGCEIEGHLDESTRASAR